MKTSIDKNTIGVTRRSLIKTGFVLSGAALLPAACTVSGATSSTPTGNTGTNTLTGRRKLGSTLEVSSIGLGVQNMSRTYQTTIPSRSEMINIIRTAFDKGVTLFDAAEAYGPHEVERI